MLETLLPNINSLKFAIIGLLAMISLVSCFLKQRTFTLSYKETSCFVVLVLIAMHFLIYSVSVDEDMQLTLLFGFCYLAFLLILRNAMGPRGSLIVWKRVALLFAITFVISNCLAAVLAFDHFVVEGNFTGLVANSNTLAALLAIICFPVLFEYSFAGHGRPRYGRYIFRALMVLTIVLIFLARSRASLLAVAIASVYYFVTMSRLNTALKVVALALVLAVVTAMLTEIGTKREGIDLLATREKLFSLRLDAIAQKPFSGWGFGSSEFTVYDEYNRFNALEKGNTILAVWEEFGIILGVFVLSLIARIWIRALRTFGRIAEGTTFLLVLLTSAVHLMFETWLFNFYGMLAMYFWGVLFLSLSFNPRETRRCASINTQGT